MITVGQRAGGFYFVQNLTAVVEWLSVSNNSGDEKMKYTKKRASNKKDTPKKKKLLGINSASSKMN